MIPDGGNNTSEKYWPDDVKGELTFGDSFVVKRSESRIPEVPGLIRRRLDILPEGKQNWHVVVQYHYTAWPERNLQDHFKPILNLCRTVKTDLGRNQGRCLVHCSDSVSRTAFFIAAMKLMDDVDECKETIDIFHLVYKMRKDRMNMVMMMKSASHRHFGEPFSLIIDQHLRLVQVASHVHIELCEAARR